MAKRSDKRARAVRRLKARRIPVIERRPPPAPPDGAARAEQVHAPLWAVESAARVGAKAGAAEALREAPNGAPAPIAHLAEREVLVGDRVYKQRGEVAVIAAALEELAKAEQQTAAALVSLAVRIQTEHRGEV